MSKKTEKNGSLREESIVEEHGLYYTKKEPRKSMSSFLRNQNKFVISGIVIADRKAMILLRLNSTIISGAIVFHDFIDTNVPGGHLVGLALIFGLSISLVFTILAAKPFSRRLAKIFKKEIQPNYPKLSQNAFLVMPGTPIEEFELAMDEIINSQELQVGNQLRAHYLMNRNLNDNFKLLNWAYDLFMGTFLLVAIIFMLARFSLIPM